MNAQVVECECGMKIRDHKGNVYFQLFWTRLLSAKFLVFRCTNYLNEDHHNHSNPEFFHPDFRWHFYRSHFVRLSNVFFFLVFEEL